MAAALCVSGFLFMFGALHIYFPDIAWNIQEQRNRASGKKSERTSEWERGNKRDGMVMIFISILIIIYANSVS